MCSFGVACLVKSVSRVIYFFIHSTKFLPNDEAEVLQKTTCTDEDLHDEDLLDILSCYKCFKNPMRENIGEIISQLAHQELIQKPRYISNCWAPILQGLKTSFESMESIKQMYEEKKPPKKVVKLLKGSP